MRIRLRKGFDLPIPGAPVQAIETSPAARSVALLGDDFPDVRAAIQVSVGDRVRIGQSLFTNRRRPELCFPSPASGTVSAVHRGEARRFIGVEVQVEKTESVEFPRVGLSDLRSWSREKTTERLLEAGDWIALRARPFGRIATPGRPPAAIFVRAMDSNPLAVDAAVVLRERPDDLRVGLTALSRLTDGPLYLCSSPGATQAPPEVERLELVEFAGPHPAGLVGTHTHHLLPVSSDRRVWYVGYQDVLAIGHLFRTGRPDPLRVISLAGPAVRSPRLLRTTIGASTEALVRGELTIEHCRIISGSVLSGRIAARPGAFLGRYHEQLCAIPERVAQASGAWWIPSWKRLRRVPWWRAAPTWSNQLHGESSAFFPLDLFERAFPLRLPISPLLRALAAGDARAAVALGALELEEEDLALSSYLCPAKLEYGPLLRIVLDQLAEQHP
jgi:Na+-transporting NADH:ubiquinone oxidoreductase subunit A